MDALIDSIERLPRKSSAPAVIVEIYNLPDVSLAGKRRIASVFLAAYKAMANGTAT